jgi:hypothetical protein
MTGVSLLAVRSSSMRCSMTIKVSDGSVRTEIDMIYRTRYTAAPAIPARAASIAPRGAAFVVTWTGAADVADIADVTDV